MAGTGGSGRPARQWKDVVENDMRVMGLGREWQAIRRLGEDDSLDWSTPASRENDWNKNLVYLRVCGVGDKEFCNSIKSCLILLMFLMEIPILCPGS